MASKDLRSRLAREEESWGREDASDGGHGLRPLLFGLLAVAAVTVAKREIPQLRRYLKIRDM